MKYRLFKDKHYIIDDGNGHLLLIDTGTPRSFSFGKHIEFEGIILPTSVLSEKQIKFSKEIIELDVDGFIGMDILRRGFTMTNDTFEFKTYKFENYFDIEFMNHAIIGKNIEICGHIINPVIDTGAMINYARKSIIGERKFIGGMYDFNPYYGSFKSDIYMGTINNRVANIGDRDFGFDAFINPSNLYNEAISFDFNDMRIYVK